MKILRALFSLVVIAAIVFGAVYVYRSCSLKSCMDGFPTLRAYAVDSNKENDISWASNVLDDLKKDTSFDAANYPERENDFSIQVIQIAEAKVIKEATVRDLFIYTYQPSGNTKPLKAISVRMSTAVNEPIAWQDYDLSLVSVSESGTLCKYLVCSDFRVKSEPLRYYDITALHRRWDKDIDGEASDGNYISKVPCEVGQRWTAYNVDDTVMYSMKASEFITITDKFVSFIRYENGFTLYDQACDSHFVAFSTDKRMDKLMEADVTYYARKGSCYISMGNSYNYEYANKTTEFVTVDYLQEASNPAHGWFADKYVWNRIEMVSDFIKKENLTDEACAALKGKQWVLRFVETSYNRSAVASGTGVTVGLYKDVFTNVTEVSILRLKFETDGNVYNLGVIDNYQSGDGKPSNVDKTGCDGFFGRIWDWIVAHWEIALAVTLVIVSVLVALEILSIIWRK